VAELGQAEERHEPGLQRLQAKVAAEQRGTFVPDAAIPEQLFQKGQQPQAGDETQRRGSAAAAEPARSAARRPSRVPAIGKYEAGYGMPCTSTLVSVKA
jgi:hypothetical protein